MSTSDSVVISRNLRQPSQAEIDAGLEREIETARLAAMNATDPELARAGFRAMSELIARRSIAKIAEMESRIEGLR